MTELEFVMTLVATLPQHAILLIALSILIWIVRERGQRIDELEQRFDRYLNGSEDERGACQ